MKHVVFNMYRELPSVAHKAAWALPFTQSLGDPNFDTGNLKMINVYYAI